VTAERMESLPMLLSSLLPSALRFRELYAPPCERWRSKFVPPLGLVLCCAGTVACARAIEYPSIPDEATRKSLLKREAACAAPSRVSSFPLAKMTLHPSPSAGVKDPTTAGPYREPPAGLLAQRTRLAECLEPGERIAVRLEPTGGAPKVEPICQAARPEAIQCVQAQIAAFAMDGPLAITISVDDSQEQTLEGLPEPHDCYTGLLTIYPHAEGVITLGFIIGPDGKVAASDVLTNATGAPELACCVENIISRHAFAPGDCRPHVVRMPFILR